MLGAAEYSKLLGALGETRDGYVCVFIPSLTRDGAPIDHEYWRTEAIRVMSKLFGGATSVNAFGGWLDDEGDGQVKEEPVSLVVSLYLRKPVDQTQCAGTEELFAPDGVRDATRRSWRSRERIISQNSEFRP